LPFSLKLRKTDPEIVLDKGDRAEIKLATLIKEFGDLPNEGATPNHKGGFDGLKGNIIANANPDYSINLPGYVIHSAIHAARPDVACVLHTHTNAGMAVSTLKCGLLPLTQTAMRWSRISYHDFEGVVVDLDEQKRLAENLGDSEVMILRNHGLLSVGQTIGQAFSNIYRLEKACQTQLLAMACNAEMSLPPQEVIARSNAQLAVSPTPDAQGRRRPQGSMEWPALKRMLDRRDASYKN